MGGAQIGRSASNLTPARLSLSTSSISFGSVTVGTSATSTITLTNSSAAGGPSVTFSQVAVTGSGFTVSTAALPIVLTPGGTSTITIQFAPLAAGTISGSLSITVAGAENPASIPLTGTGIAAAGTVAGVTPGQLTMSPSSLSFGSVVVGSSQTLPATLTNAGGASVTITQASFSGGAYSVSGLGLPVTLSAGQSASFAIVFAPQSAGTSTSTLSIASNASNATLTASVTGIGVTPGSLTASAPSLSFGNVQVGSSETLPETLTNSGGSSVTVTQAAFSGGGYSTTGLNLPITLQAGESASFDVVFAPASAGTDNFNLSIASNASNPTLTIPVTGSGIAAANLSAGSTSLSFGNVTVGSSQTLPETLTNNSTSSSITVTKITTSTAYSVTGLSLPVTLNAGQSASFSVVFAPTTAGAKNASLSIANSGATLTVALSGTGVTPGTLAATSVNFGSVQIGNSSTQTSVLTNTGGSSVTVSQATLAGAGFSMSGLSLPLNLNAGQSFTFTVVFTPQDAGAASGSISLVSNASGTTPTISLSGTGTAPGQFSISPASLSFGSVVVGASKSLTVTLSAAGAAVTVTSASVSNSQFALSGPSLPLTIAAGATASFTLSFTPQSNAAASATVSFVSNASGAPITESVTGTGTAAPQHQVNLSWSESGSDVASYNIYRGSASGGPYVKINSSTVTSYTDQAVDAGQTYYYVVTSVGSNGTESGYSNEVSAVVPTP